jgi:hypothetical protein
MSGDGHHITQPHPEGLGARLAMERALRGSSLQAHHVAYINAHATSTPQGEHVYGPVLYGSGFYRSTLFETHQLFVDSLQSSNEPD